MNPSQDTNTWTAALVSDEQILIWSVSDRQTGQPQRIPRRSPSGQDDLVLGLRQVAADQSCPVLVCGLQMAGPVTVPAKPVESPLFHQPCEGWDLYHIPALSQQTPRAGMAGQALQVAGFLALNPKWDGVVCLPGPITQWVLVSAAEVVSFQSALTPHLYRAMALAMGLAAADGQETTEIAWSESALVEAAADTMSRPERLACRLAELQTAVQLDAMPVAEASGRLWGALLGADLAAARPYWLGQNLALIGPDALAAPYMAALAAQGLPATQADPERMALEGLIQIWRHHNSTADSAQH